MPKKIYFLSIVNNEIVELDVFRNYVKDRYYLAYDKKNDTKFYVGYDECCDNYSDVVKLKLESLREQLSEKEKQVTNIKYQIEFYEKEISKDGSEN